MESESEDDSHHPQMVGEYVLGVVIGEGSYGEVRDAMQKNGLRVAVKQLSTARVKRAKATDMVRREIEITKHLKQYPHHNVVKVSDVIEDLEGSTDTYLVMELIKGGSLSYLLEATPAGRLPLDAMRSYFNHLMHGLAHIHEKGIVHRDIKPENLMITISGVAKIIDFGEAERLSLFGNDGRAILLRTKGTPQFQAPQIASGVGSVNGTAVDVWSAGITLWRALLGNYPFNGSTVMMLYESILNDEPEFPEGSLQLSAKSEAVLSIQECPHLIDLLKGMLAKTEEHRISVQRVLTHPWVVGGASAGFIVNQSELFPIQLPQVGSISFLRKLSGLYENDTVLSSEARSPVISGSPEPSPAGAEVPTRSLAAASALFDPPNTRHPARSMAAANALFGPPPEASSTGAGSMAAANALFAAPEEIESDAALPEPSSPDQLPSTPSQISKRSFLELIEKDRAERKSAKVCESDTRDTPAGSEPKVKQAPQTPASPPIRENNEFEARNKCNGCCLL
eukprot:TRINITY_DN5067_c0_g1_i1.p1 TRINITY_DN5067_c0_g1~~TRINITY_DN5067_c0_g1_i1.p1  ORF type:complete len:510 (+),score=65.97 TRINITY_DN5067_c0_g1_i1:152-1681(+)